MKTTRQTHGMWKSKEWNSWNHIKGRCLNPNDPKFKNYGARGIQIDSNWLVFENFLKDMGKAPSQKHSIDRINNDGHYCRDNCRWALPIQQSKNRRKKTPGYKRAAMPKEKVKGWQRIGEQNGRSKISDKDLVEILKLRASATLKEIANIYGVDISTISRLLRNTTRLSKMI